MASERVKVELHDKRSHVVADFTFRNEGLATKVVMAFPEESHQYPPTRAIGQLTSWVDGKRVHCERIILPTSGSKHNSDYVAAWLKSVTFAAHQTRHVRVDYWARNGDIGDYVWNGYILTTGATWKGKIGRVQLDVDWSSFRGKSEPRFEWEYGDLNHPAHLFPTGPRSGRIVISNLEPMGDLRMIWTNAFWNFNVNGNQIQGDGYGYQRNQIVWGADSDPVVDLAWVPAVFGPVDAEDEPKVGRMFKAGRHRIQVIDGAIVKIDSKRVRLRRPPPKHGLYLRDLVQAIGGSFHYRKSEDRVYIRI